MIKIPKRPLSRFKAILVSIERFFPIRAVFYSALFIFFYFFVPFELTLRGRHIISLKQFAVFYLSNILLGIYVFRKNFHAINNVNIQREYIQEKTNLLNDENRKALKNKLAMQEQTKRYHTLKEIIAQINQDLSLDSISEKLLSISHGLIANHAGNSLLYLVDNSTQKIVLFKTKKEDKKLVIKSKEGDIFDIWVARHVSPLLIEDIKKDFRFDIEKLQELDLRPISSLVSAPFLSEEKFLGLLRLDNTQANVYSQDDLRFLMAICDLGAVALENGELFQNTQNLAIHDGLTSLFTKGYFLERLQEECRRYARSNKSFSLLMIDIDYFKNYNDQFGHTAGDIVLKNLSADISEFLKNKSALVSRFGGEEFCVILYEDDKKEALRISEQLLDLIKNKKLILRRQETSVTVSIGVASYPQDANDEVGLVIKADRAMYEAKQKGRNRVCLS